MNKRVRSTMTLRLERLSTCKAKVLAVLSVMVGLVPVAFGMARMIPMYGQILHTSGPLPSFEVASIRPWKPTVNPASPPPGVGAVPTKIMKASPVGGGGQSTERVHFIGQTSLLIASAYNLPIGSRGRITGEPDWVDSESNRYELQAKIEDNLYAAMQKMAPDKQREQVALMEQSVLADRFKLKLHFETVEMPLYALVITKGGPKLTTAESGESSKLSNLDTQHGSEMTAKAVTLDEFVHSPLLRTGGRMVVDRTGLKERYNFTLKWSTDQHVATDAGLENSPDAPSLFTAIQEQLGLKLIASKGPVEVIVIDHIERPSEN